MERQQYDHTNIPLPQKISDLLAYYGYENVFGSCYWKGLAYTDIVKEEN